LNTVAERIGVVVSRWLLFEAHPVGLIALESARSLDHEGAGDGEARAAAAGVTEWASEAGWMTMRFGRG
jgi:hypothetical protein